MLFCIGFALYFLGIKTFANMPYFSSIVAGLVLELATIQTSLGVIPPTRPGKLQKLANVRAKIENLQRILKIIYQ